MSEKNRKVAKIVLAGGPCSGKTSTFRALKNMLSTEYLTKVTFIDEVASTVIKEYPELVTNKIKFQKAIFERQSAEEQDVAEGVDLIISDRGKADAFIYLSEDEIKSADYLKNLSLFKTLNEYDAVIYFESNNAFYKNNDDTIRVENDAEEASIVTTRTKEVWMQHHNVICIGMFDSIEEKAEYVAMQINRICKNRIFNKAVVKI